MSPAPRPTPRFSAICSAFNVERYIDETIESVRAQTRSDWELVIVDDGSTDATWAKLESWAARDDRIRVARQANQGYGVGRNHALGLARAPVAGILDADDVWEPGYIERLVPALESESPDCVGVFCHAVGIDADGRRLAAEFTVQPGRWNLERTVLQESPGRSGSTYVFRVEDLRRIGGFETQKLKVGMDVELLYRLLYTRGPAAYLLGVAHKLVRYRMHPEGLSTRMNSQRVPQFHYLAASLSPHLGAGADSRMKAHYFIRCYDQNGTTPEMVGWARRGLSGGGWRQLTLRGRLVLLAVAATGRLGIRITRSLWRAFRALAR